MIKRLFSTVLLLFLITTTTTQAQIFTDTKHLAGIKDGTTYVLVNRLVFPRSKDYLESIKKGWTLTKDIRFMAIDDFNMKISSNDNFTSTDSFISIESVAISAAGSVGFNHYYQLRFWRCSGDYLKKGKSFKLSDQEMVASLPISVTPKAIDFSSYHKSKSTQLDFVTNMDFDGGDLLYNWGPGMVGNYFQQMSRLLLSGKNVNLDNDVKNLPELAKLSNQTLFVPSSALVPTSELDPKKIDEKAISSVFAKYEYNYKILTIEELDKKILETDKPFYYLLFIKVNLYKTIFVIDALTGESIYYEGTFTTSDNLKTSDLKDLSKAIGKQASR